MSTASMKIHPLVAAAAASVILVSAVGTAAIMGWLPGSHSADNPAPQAAAQSATTVAEPAPAVAEAPAPAPKPAAKPVATAPERPAPARSAPQRSAPPASATPPLAQPAPEAAPVVAAVPACIDCGKVTEVRTVEVESRPSGVGVVAGAVVGGLLGNQVGGGNGKKLATVAGAIGGGYAGNEIEKRTRKASGYEVEVRMQDGQTRVFKYDSEPAWRTGDPIRVVNGELAAR